MPTVPELPESITKQLKPTDTMIVCTRGGKPLPASDFKELEKFIKHIKDRKAKHD